MHDLLLGLADVNEVPLGGVVEQTLRLEDGDEALSLLEATRRSDRRVHVRLGVEAGPEAPPEDSVEEDLIKQCREVVGAPPHLLLELFDHRNERAEVREEDHVAREVVLELIAEVRVPLPQQLRILGEKDPFKDLERGAG